MPMALVLSDAPSQLYGAARQYAHMQEQMRRSEFVQVVAGPPGTMKTTLIRRAASEAGLDLQVVEIDYQSTAKLEQMIRKLGTCGLSDSKEARAIVWLVLGAELLPNDAVVWKAAAAGGKRIFLEMTDVPPSFRSGRGKLDVLYFNRVSEANVRAFLRDKGMATGAALTAVVERSQGDLHQAVIVASGWVAGGGKDTVPHLWFDTKKLVNPGCPPRSADRVDLGWVQHNALSRISNLEHAAAFAETCAFADSFGLYPNGQTALDEMSGDMLQRALKQCARNYGDRVERPPQHAQTAQSRGAKQRQLEMARRADEERMGEECAKRDGNSNSNSRKRARSEESQSRRPLEAADSGGARSSWEGASVAGAGSAAAAAATATPVQPVEAPSAAASCPPPLYDGSPHFRIVSTQAAQSGRAATPALTLGNACANHCKGRQIVVGCCTSIDDYAGLTAVWTNRNGSHRKACKD